MNLRFVLESTLGSQVLHKTPNGWDQMTIKVLRDPILHGMSMEFPISLQAFCDAGREYILNAYKELGIDAEVTLRIEMSCGCSDNEIDAPDYSIDYSDDYGSMSGANDCDWDELVSGLIDMKGIKTNDRYVSFALIQSSEHQKFKSRYDNQVNTSSTEDLDGNEVDTLEPFETTLHNKGITLISDFNIPAELAFVEYQGPAPSDPYLPFYHHTPPFVFNENFIQTGFSIDGYAEGGADLVNVPDIFTNTTPFSRIVNVEGVIRVLVQLGVCAAGSLRTRYWLRSYFGVDGFGNPNWVDSYQLDTFDLCFGDDPLREMTFDYDFLMLPLMGIKLYSIVEVDNASSGTEPNAYLYDSINSEVRISGQLVIPDSTTKNFPIFEACALVSSRILGGNDKFRSKLFGRKNSWPYEYEENGCDSFTILANGLNLRGKNYEKCPITMSPKDLFEGLSPIYNLGMGLKKFDDEYKVVLDKKEEFYDDTVLFRLSNVPNIQTSLMTDYFFSELRFGYSNWETEEVSGIDEINTKRYYNTGIKAVSNVLEKISPFITSGYSIQLTRQKQFFDDGTDEDYKNDNETFLICTNRSVDGDGVPTGLDTAEKAENFADGTGIQFFNSSYNLRVSPERNKLRHAPIISSCLLKYPARECKFTYGEGNYEASYRGTDSCDVFSNEILSGNQNVAWDDPNITEEPVWNPIVDEFEYPITVAQMKALIDEPEKAIEYSTDDTNYRKGFILTADIIVVNGKTKFKVLRSYD